MFHIQVVEKMKTDFFVKKTIFLKTVTYEIMWKNREEPEVIHDNMVQCMWFAC
jgi:hypothetical protein